MFDALGKLPIWQRLLIFVFVSGAIVGVWYWMFYLDAVSGRKAADAALVAAQNELAEVQTSRDNFDAEQKKIAEEEKQMQQNREVLPLNASTVDNLMQTFQQQSRLVGMTVESWTNEPEQFEDFYARMPIKVQATGTWMQVGEFFRRVTELKRIVSVDGLSLALASDKASKDKSEAPEHPQLVVEFEAATYRFLTDAEREAAASTGTQKNARRRKKP